MWELQLNKNWTVIIIKNCDNYNITKIGIVWMSDCNSNEWVCVCDIIYVCVFGLRQNKIRPASKFCWRPWSRTQTGHY